MNSTHRPEAYIPAGESNRNQSDEYKNALNNLDIKLNKLLHTRGTYLQIDLEACTEVIKGDIVFSEQGKQVLIVAISRHYTNNILLKEAETLERKNSFIRTQKQISSHNHEVIQKSDIENRLPETLDTPEIIKIIEKVQASLRENGESDSEYRENIQNSLSLITQAYEIDLKKEEAKNKKRGILTQINTDFHKLSLEECNSILEKNGYHDLIKKIQQHIKTNQINLNIREKIKSPTKKIPKVISSTSKQVDEITEKTPYFNMLKSIGGISLACIIGYLTINYLNKNQDSSLEVRESVGENMQPFVDETLDQYMVQHIFEDLYSKISIDFISLNELINYYKQNFKQEVSKNTGLHPDYYDDNYTIEKGRFVIYLRNTISGGNHTMSIDYKKDMERNIAIKANASINHTIREVNSSLRTGNIGPLIQSLPRNLYNKGLLNYQLHSIKSIPNNAGFLVNFHIEGVHLLIEIGRDINGDFIISN